MRNMVESNQTVQMSCDKGGSMLAPRVEEVAAAIVDVLVAIDDIRLQVNPALEAEYMMKVGYMENAAMEAKISMLRAKRKLALAQMRANAGDAIDEAAIERTLDKEFADWQDQLEAAMVRYTASLERFALCETMSPADSALLKKLYRAIAKRLHPDLCPDATEQEQLWFAAAQKAYARGDVGVLQSIAVALGISELEASGDVAEDGDDAVLSAQLVLLEAQLAKHAAELEQLQSAFPYTVKDKLRDPRWVAAKVAEAQRLRDEYLAARQEYTSRYEKLKEGVR